MIKNIILTLLLGVFTISSIAQNSITVKVISDEKDPLPGASIFVKNTKIGNETDLDGLATINNIPDGKQTFIVSFIGFGTVEKTVQFPNSKEQVIFLPNLE